MAALPGARPAQGRAKQPERHRSAAPPHNEEREAMLEPEKLAETRIAIVGLGYVGLPLAVEFGRHYDTVGFDINAARVAELQSGRDSTLEASAEELAGARRLRYTTDLEQLRDRHVFIVTVPTPIDDAKRPDLGALLGASRTVAKVLKKGDIVVYESTVYPGATEEDCAPVLERESGLKANRDFFLGYSPERINPGDKEHRLTTIRKITAGSTPAAAQFIDRLYASIIGAGTYPASSIRVAEAAKVIENTQRDVNIALINELALIFNRMGLDTLEVLEAAGTKWNFLPFRPGLVGGHCIGVDPYYLTHKSQQIGYHPEMILAGRRINDNMGLYVASEVVKLMVRKGMSMPKSRILLLGFTFKENCPDVRNTRVVDLVKELRSYGAQVDIWDPWADGHAVHEEYGLDLLPRAPAAGTYDGVVLAVAHRQFREMGAAAIRGLGKPGAVLYDIKSMLPAAQVDARL
jgi:UDP-N-acetyl-D-galactosamine dehydrogenase